MSVQWGDVPAWAGAILTSGSVFAAYIALRRTQRQAERRQADHVHVVIEEGTVTIHNGSTAPIYLPQLGRARYDPRKYRRWPLILLARFDGPVRSHLLNGDKMEVPGPSKWRKLKGGISRKWLGVTVPISSRRLGVADPISAKWVEGTDYYVLLFRDASGQHWFRSAAGDTIRTDWRNVWRDAEEVGGSGAPEQVTDD
jgi:hypothetical protein